MTDLKSLITHDWPELAAAAGGALALGALAVTGLRRLRRREKGRARALAAPVFVMGAVLSTVLSTNSSWRYFGLKLGVSNVAERAVMFAVLEVVLLACGLGAWENLKNPKKGSSGVPGVAVWVIAGFAAVPAFSVADGSLSAGLFRVLLGPVNAVFCFHQALGMDLRARRPEAKSHSLLATLGRTLRERILARLGLGAVNRSALELAQERAVIRASVLSDRLRVRTEAQRSNTWGRYLARRLRRQLRLAGVAGDPARAGALLDHLAVAHHAVGLSDLQFASPWDTHSAVIANGHRAAPTPTPDTASEDNGESPDTMSETTAPDMSVTDNGSDTVSDQGADTDATSGADTTDGVIELPRQADGRGRRVRTSAPDTADVPADVAALVPAALLNADITPKVAEVVRQVYRDEWDTGTIRAVVAHVLPGAKPNTIDKAIGRHRVAHGRQDDGGQPPVGQYL